MALDEAILEHIGRGESGPTFRLYRRNKHAALLAVLAATTVWSSFAHRLVLNPVVSDVLMTVIILTVLLTIFTGRIERMAAFAVAAVSVAVNWSRYVIDVAGGHLLQPVAFHAMMAAFLGYTVWVILRDIFAGQTITRDEVLGTVCGYLLAAMAWANVYAVIELTAPGSAPALQKTKVHSIEAVVDRIALKPERFVEGAWMVVVVIPALVVMFYTIRRHYVEMTRQIDVYGYRPPKLGRHPVVVLVGGMNRGVIAALTYARAISPNVTALTVDLDSTSTARLQMRWGEWAPDVPLVVLESPYRSVSQPILHYVDQMEKQRDGDYMTIILPEFVPARWWQYLLHNQTALLIKAALLFRRGKVAISIPYHLER